MYHLKYICLEERDEQHGDGDQLTDVLEPIYCDKIHEIDINT